jgi:hypothetical protein
MMVFPSHNDGQRNEANHRKKVEDKQFNQHGRVPPYQDQQLILIPI